MAAQYEVLWDYSNIDTSKYLIVKKGDQITVTQDYGNGWSMGNKDGKSGVVPTSYIRQLPAQNIPTQNQGYQHNKIPSTQPAQIQALNISQQISQTQTQQSNEDEYYEVIYDYKNMFGDKRFIQVTKGDVVKLIKKELMNYEVEKNGQRGLVPKVKLKQITQSDQTSTNVLQVPQQLTQPLIQTQTNQWPRTKSQSGLPPIAPQPIMEPVILSQQLQQSQQNQTISNQIQISPPQSSNVNPLDIKDQQRNVIKPPNRPPPPPIPNNPKLLLRQNSNPISIKSLQIVESLPSQLQESATLPRFKPQQSNEDEYYEVIEDYMNMFGAKRFIQVTKGDVVKLIKKESMNYEVEKNGQRGLVPKVKLKQITQSDQTSTNVLQVPQQLTQPLTQTPQITSQQPSHILTPNSNLPPLNQIPQIITPPPTVQTTIKPYQINQIQTIIPNQPTVNTQPSASIQQTYTPSVIHQTVSTSSNQQITIQSNIGKQSNKKHVYTDYKIIRELSSGGAFGRIFVVNLDEDQFIMKKVPYGTPEQKKMADQEVKQMKLAQSNYTVQFFESFPYEQDMCIVMELTILYQYQVLMALKHLHSQGIAHRDLKPDNVFIDEDDTAKTGDYGLAQDMGSKSYIMAAGTKNYSPPEAHLENKMTVMSDIWALGAIIFEMLLGKHPFEGETQMDTIENIKKGKFHPIPDFVPQELKLMIVAMLSPDAIKRPTAEELLSSEIMHSQEQIEKQKDIRRKMKQELKIKDQQLREALERVHINEENARYQEQRAREAEDRIRRLEDEKSKNYGEKKQLEDKIKFQENQLKETQQKEYASADWKKNTDMKLTAIWNQKFELLKNLLFEQDPEKINMLIWMDFTKDLEQKEPSDESEIQSARQKKEQICETVTQTFYNKLDDVGRQVAINSGLPQGLIFMFQNQPLESITRTHSMAFCVLTHTRNNDIWLQLGQFKPFPALSRLLTHSDVNVIHDAISSLSNIMTGATKTTSDVIAHPYYQDLMSCNGIQNIYMVFSKNYDKFSTDLSAFCISQAYRAKEISDPTMKREIIKYLKVQVNDQDKFTKNQSIMALNRLAYVAGNRQEIERDGFRIPEQQNEKGRLIASIKPIGACEIILRESSIATVLYNASRTKFCGYCTDKLPSIGGIHCPRCGQILYCCENCLNADSLLHKYECLAYQKYSQDLLCDSDSVHLMRLCSVFIHNEKHLHPLYANDYPTIQLKQLLTPVQRYFDLVEHEKNLKEHTLKDKNLVDNALSLFSYEELLAMLYNFVKYGVYQGNCTICGRSRKPQEGQTRHCQKWEKEMYKQEEEENGEQEQEDEEEKEEEEKEEEDDDEEEDEEDKPKQQKDKKKIIDTEKYWKKEDDDKDDSKNLDKSKERRLKCLQYFASKQSSSSRLSSISKISPSLLMLPIECLRWAIHPLLMSALSIADCNAHSIFRDTGFGMFYIGSMFNHSCAPNSAFCHDRRGNLILITLRPIRSGEEITIDYSEICVSLERSGLRPNGWGSWLRYGMSQPEGRFIRKERAKVLNQILKKDKKQKINKVRKQIKDRTIIKDDEFELSSSESESSEKGAVTDNSQKYQNDEDKYGRELYGVFDNGGGRSGSWGCIQPDDWYKEEEQEVDEEEEQNKEEENDNQERKNVRKQLKQGGNEIPNGPDVSEEIIEEVEEMIKQMRIEASQEADLEEQQENKMRERFTKKEMDKEEDISQQQQLELFPHTKRSFHNKLCDIAEQDEEIRYNFWHRLLQQQTEWDDVLTSFCCAECGMPMREIQKDKLEIEMKIWEETKQKEKEEKEKMNDDNNIQMDKDNDNDNKQDDNTINSSSSIEYITPLDSLLQHIESISQVPNGKEIEYGIIHKQLLEVEDAMSELDQMKYEEEEDEGDKKKNQEKEKEETKEENGDVEVGEKEDKISDQEKQEQERRFAQLEQSVDNIVKEWKISQIQQEAEKDDSKDNNKQEMIIDPETEKKKIEDENERENKKYDEQRLKIVEEDGISKFSCNWRDHTSIFVCRKHPSTHPIIAGKRAYILQRRAARGFSRASDGEVDADNYSDRMPGLYFIETMQTLNKQIKFFKPLLHPFHETMIQSMYGSACLLYNCFILSNITGWFCEVDPRLLAPPPPQIDSDTIEDDRPEQLLINKQNDYNGNIISNDVNNDNNNIANTNYNCAINDNDNENDGQKEKGIEKEEIKDITNKQNTLSESSTPKSSSTYLFQTRADYDLAVKQCMDHLLSSPHLAVLFTNMISPAVVSSIARYIVQYVRLIYFPGYPRRVLDLKMCGILLVLVSMDAPSHVDPRPMQIKVLQQYKCFQEGINVLTAALEEGIQCYGIDHCEVKEIQHWINGGWKELFTWERRCAAIQFLHIQRAPVKSI
ncbi:MAG: putative nek protein kinase [Streblomastix strix]|uniref:Putative nek protein kinase n=1 Tax=Streblomastix strix TaxID=222440 RepID=A0A5J4WZH9_9EUKA|nr:MAG: putative nek protein kinase [Streblomastix strix]